MNVYNTILKKDFPRTHEWKSEKARSILIDSKIKRI